MSDYSPVYSGGNKPYSATTSAAVTGGRLLAVSGSGTVAHAGAASAVVVGVAAHDAPSGGRVSVWPLANAVHVLPAPGAVDQGVAVIAAANGQVAAAAAETGLALLGVSASAKDGDGFVRVVGR